MAGALPRTREELESIREELRARARAMRLPSEDIDEIVDRALARAANEPRPDPRVPFGRRAGAALWDERAEYWRRRKARVEIDADADVPERGCLPVAQQRLEFSQLVSDLRATLGDEAVQYIVLICAGHTEREIAERPGWDRLRAGRVRKQIERHGPEILSKLIDRTRHKEAS